MEESKSNKSLIIMIISLVIVIAAGSFAWLSFRSPDMAMVLTIGDLDGMSVTLKPYQIESSLSPVSTYQDGIVVDVTADNQDIKENVLKLYYKIDTIDDALKSQNFKYTITKCTANCDTPSNYAVINNAGGNFANALSNSNLDIYKENIQAGETYKYKVYLWIDGSGGNQSNMQNKTFNGEIRANLSESLYAMITDNAVMDNTSSTYVTNSSGVQFNDVSSDTNGKGVYLRAGTQNDTYPIYYYRGAVDDNNVLFGGFCWKIVRTTSTGGIKLIYNGAPTGTNNTDCANTNGTIPQTIATSSFNDNIDSPADVGYMYGTRYIYSSDVGTGWYYAPDVTYSNGTYTLVSNNNYNVEIKNSVNDGNLNYHHYTCGSATETTCASVKFVYVVSSSTVYYLNLTNGRKIEDALDEMLTNSSNTNDSVVKAVVDTWYNTYMTSYTNKLEDTPYCNDRRIGDLNGMRPTGSTTGIYSGYLYLASYKRAKAYTPSLTCNTNDAFTVSASNGNGKLTYPVGLLTTDEVMLAGGKLAYYNPTFYLLTNQTWWLGTPSCFAFSNSNNFYVISNGNMNNFYSNGNYAVRPVVSLKAGTEFSGGDGTAVNPYFVK